MPALVQTPTSVPIVSNISMKRKVKTMTTISMEKTLEKSNWQKIGETEGGTSTSPCISVMPIGMPMSVVARIPMSRLPGTFLMTSTLVRMMPITPSRAEPSVILPMVTKVASLAATIPAFFRPMKAMKRPIPAPMARFREAGIASTIIERIPVAERMMKMKPSMRTAVSAICQE